MRIMIVPMVAMAESFGCEVRSRSLASAMALRGWDVLLCVPEGFAGSVPNGVHTRPIVLPSPLGLPRFLGKRMFSLARRIGVNRHVPISSFDDVLKLTGNTDGRYLEAAVGQLRSIIREEGCDAVYSEFSIAAILAARAEGIPVFGTTSFPTQPSFVSDPGSVKGVNRILDSLSMEPVSSPEDVLLMPRIRFVPSCRELEPFPVNDSVVFTGPFSGITAENSGVTRDAVVAYLGNGAVSPRKACEVLTEALRGSGLDLYIAGLPEGEGEHLHTAWHFDFSELLPRAAVFANHGGQNSVMDGISFGAPQLICPGKVFERRFNAEAAVRCGIGFSLAHDCFNVKNVRRAIGKLTEDEGYRDSANALRSRLAGLGGVNKVIASIERAMTT